MKKVHILIPGILFLLHACADDKGTSDAFGNFESISVMVAAESQGRIKSLSLEEGQKLAKDVSVGTIDTMQLHLRKMQMLAGIKTINTRANTIEAQIRSQQVQLENMQKELLRITKLLKDGAATAKQKDDMDAKITFLKSQIRAVETQRSTIVAEKNTLHIQIEQIDDLIARSAIINPLDGVVLQKYKFEGEIVGPGQSIYKIADLSKLILRAYISGKQLSQVKIGQMITVRIDGSNGIEELPGKLTWISSQAEFTPKIIQTREERVNLVYAVKVEVENDGTLKIGMPGEIKF